MYIRSPKAATKVRKQRITASNPTKEIKRNHKKDTTNPKEAKKKGGGWGKQE